MCDNTNHYYNNKEKRLVIHDNESPNPKRRILKPNKKNTKQEFRTKGRNHRENQYNIRRGKIIMDKEIQHPIH